MNFVQRLFVDSMYYIAPWYEYIRIQCGYNGKMDKKNTWQRYHIYDIVQDIIRLEYTEKGNRYTLCFPIEKYKEIIPAYTKIIDENISSGNVMTEHSVIDATMNGDICITDRVNRYLGNNARHIKYCPIEIQWILTAQEIIDFKDLTVMLGNCDEIQYLKVTDTIAFS